jgi:hypothetical protein
MAKRSKLLSIILSPIIVITHLVMRFAFTPETGAIVAASGRSSFFLSRRPEYCTGNTKPENPNPISDSLRPQA